MYLSGRADGRSARPVRYLTRPLMIPARVAARRQTMRGAPEASCRMRRRDFRRGRKAAAGRPGGGVVLAEAFGVCGARSRGRASRCGVRRTRRRGAELLHGPQRHRAAAADGRGHGLADRLVRWRERQLPREGEPRLEQAQGLAPRAVVQAAVAHLAEALGQDVLQEAADELVRKRETGGVIQGGTRRENAEYQRVTTAGRACSRLIQRRGKNQAVVVGLIQKRRGI